MSIDAFGPITDNANGTYTATYTPVLAGADQIAITLGGAAIGGSPYASAVSAGHSDSKGSGMVAARTTRSGCVASTARSSSSTGVFIPK